MPRFSPFGHKVYYTEHMTLFFSITLGISIVGLILLLTFKRIELMTGRVLFRGARPMVGGFFARGLSLIEHVIPGVLQRAAKAIVRAVQRGVHFFIMRSALLFERTLISILRRVREKTRAPRGTGEVSGFLKEVSEHKRSLLEEPQSKRAIFDDQG